MQLDSLRCPAGQMLHLSPSTDADGPAKKQITRLASTRIAVCVCVLEQPCMMTCLMHWNAICLRHAYR